MYFKTLFSIFAVIMVMLQNNGINAGQVVVLHSPKSLGFSSNFGKQQLNLKDLYSAALGVSTPQKNCCKWIYFVDPFDAPEAVVEVYVAGVPDVGAFSEKYKVFSMEDQAQSDTYEFVIQKLAILYQNDSQSSTLVNLHLNDAKQLQLYKDIFSYVEELPNMPKSSFNLADATHEGFIQELNILRRIIAAIGNHSIKRDHIKDFYHLRFSSMLPLIEKHGLDSVDVLEAKRLLKQQLEELSDSFVVAYSGEVMVTAVTSDSDKGGYRRDQRWVEKARYNPGVYDLRSPNEITTTPMGANTLGRYGSPGREEEEEGRQGPEGEDPTTPPEVPKIITENNNPNSPDANHPEEIHLIFWTCFVLGFTLVAIVQVFMELDPGRDSIVYRLTDNLIRNKVE